MNLAPRSWPLMLVVLLATAASSAQAGVQSQMDKMFGEMSARSNPVVHMGARRGVISGGSYMSRNRVMDLHPWTFTPPSASGGCGGIDAFAGSLSFASRDEWIAMVRSIAAAAKGYAFKIAVDAVSSMIGTELENFQKMIGEWNKFHINSCEAAQRLVNGIGSYAQESAATYRSSHTMASDEDAASNQGSRVSAAQVLSQQAPAAFYGQFAVNYVWEGMKKAKTATWFSGGDQQLLEELMSITGTVITCIPGDSSIPCGADTDPIVTPSQKGELETFSVAGPLHLLDLVEGSSGQDNANPTMISVYRCGSDRDHCLAPKLEKVSIRGFLPRLRDVLLGPNNNTGEGLIGHFARMTGAPTKDEKALLTSLGDFGTKILNMSRLNEQMARDYCVQYMVPIAVDVVYHMMRQMIDAVEIGASAQGGLAMNLVQARFAEARRQLDADRFAVEGKVQTLQSMMTTYVNMMSTVRPNWKNMVSLDSHGR